MICASTLKKGTGPKSQALSEMILRKSKDAYLRQCAYTATIKREGSRGRDTILEDLGTPGQFRSALQAVQDLYQGARDERIVAALAEQAKAKRNDNDLLLLARAFIAVGGDCATSEARALALRLPDDQRKRLLRDLSNETPLELARRLIAAGVIANTDVTQLIAKASAQIKEEEGISGDRTFSIVHVGDGINSAGVESGKVDAPRLLEAHGIFFGFDVETSEVPVRHDELLAQFAKASGGAFQPEACHENMLKKNEDDDEAPYRVQFIHRDRLYCFEARNFGDWYDVEAVVKACNQALQDSGSPKRFYQAESDGQCASFLCVTPEHAKILSEQFNICFEESLGKSMRLGKEFEEQVRGQLDPK